MFRIIKSRGRKRKEVLDYEKLLNEEEDNEMETTADEMKYSPSASAMKVDTIKNKASLGDIRDYWSIAVSPSFRDRRNAALFDKMEEDMVSMRIIKCSQTLYQIGFL